MADTSLLRDAAEKAALTEENIASLRALVPGMSVMDYRAALANAYGVEEAVVWLRHKRLSHI
jgi:translation elongation factor EF-Ts